MNETRRQPLIIEVHGNILTHLESEAIVNPVNCVGIMGRGLAKQFRRSYPTMVREYQDICRTRTLKPGVVYIHTVATPPATPQYVVSFPTKDHWKDPSQLIWIASGMSNLLQQLRQRHIASVAIPALGAGLGGLPWPEVRREIITAAELYPSITTTIITIGGRP